MDSYKLTDYGTIIDCDGNENNVDYYINMWKTNDNNLSFSSKNMSFELENEDSSIVPIVLSKKQRNLLVQRKPSPEVLKLIAYSEKCKYQEKEESINQNFLNTGELPTDTEELAILNEYYRKELTKTNATIIKDSFVSTVMPTISLLSTYGLYTLMSPDDLIFKVLIGTISIVGGVAVSLIPAILMDGLGQDPLPIKDIIENFRKTRVLKRKIKYIDESEEKRTALEAENSFTLEGLENKEMKTIANNGNVFLQELEEVKKKIVMLPSDEREPYIRELIDIVSIYDLQVTDILGKDGKKLSFGSATNLWDLNVNMLPKLLNLGSRLELRLSTIKEKQELKESLKQFKNSVETLDTGKGYVDGWTDGYTEGLTGSGVAYAQSVQQRKN